MATISEVLKALNTTTMYEEEILNVLRSSEQYGNKVNLANAVSRAFLKSI